MPVKSFLTSLTALRRSPAARLRALYDRWAPSYPPTAHNPVMRVEQAAMARLLPEVRGRRALDLACGSGRYAQFLLARGAQSVMALDFSPGMLARADVSQRVCATMMQLPFAVEAFDVLVSGLAVGHAPNLLQWMHECARILRLGGSLLYSDFHPFARQAGWRRSFRAGDGRVYHVPFRAYEVAQHRSAMREAGLTPEVIQELRVGIDLTEPFEGSADFYRRWHGNPIVLVASARKMQ